MTDSVRSLTTKRMLVGQIERHVYTPFHSLTSFPLTEGDESCFSRLRRVCEGHFGKEAASR